MDTSDLTRHVSFNYLKHYVENVLKLHNALRNFKNQLTMSGIFGLSTVDSSAH